VPVIARALGAAAPWRGMVTRAKPVDAPIPPSSGVIVNAGQSGYYRTQYELALFEKLAAAFASLSSIDQLGLLYDTRMLGYSGDAPLSNLLGLARRADRAMHPRVLATVAERLDAIDFFHRGLPTRAAYRAFGRKVLQPLFADVGWDAKPGESENIPPLRETLTLVLANFDDATVIGEARRLFSAYLKNPDSLTGEKRRAVLLIAAQHADAATWDEIHKLAKAAESAVEKQRYYTYLGLAFDKALAERALALTLTDEIEPPTRPQIIAAVSGEYPELAFDFVLGHRDLVMGWIEPSSRERYVPALLSNSMDPASIGKLQAYSETYIPATARRSAEVVAGEMAFNIMVREKRLPEIGRWLALQGS
jgi:aminopeptidase N